MRMAGVAATALDFVCAAFSRGDPVPVFEGVESPSAASNAANAKQPMAAQKPVPGNASNAPVITPVPSVNCSTGRSFAPVINSAAQIRPMMASAAEANREARSGINDAASPSIAQASKATAMGARAFT